MICSIQSLAKSRFLDIFVPGKSLLCLVHLLLLVVLVVHLLVGVLGSVPVVHIGVQMLEVRSS